ncbi:serine hydrolase FSH [Daldinia loculata]|uniref:serine hydrolase FSH n=1 Tax=Daldinia loculata TaxID=103429 RepID=UPI0020C29AF6|nr:serine hydrolase FSH [Daldinia loculata]KAI1651120.1 serine hydrolase FSH [Daldinia loculata]
MHFLCLHGAGTNSKIFEFQIALRHELGGDHTYDFVEGVVAQHRALGIENLATSEDLCFAYYKPHNAESFKKAVEDLEKYIKTDGPFDGIIAFSQGVSLACAIFVDELRLRESGLRCGIFFSGRPPFIDAGTPLTHYSHPTTPVKAGEVPINIPTVHIWGAEDKIEPGQALALSRLCRSENRYEHIHGGGHEVPGSRDKEGLIESANVIRRMLAQLGCN